MAERIRIGLIGCGGISRAHARGYLQSPELFEVVACCDERKEMAEERAKQLNAKFVTTDYREVIARDDIDAVDICLPHHLHAEVTIAAARSGKHVLVEKPIANTLEEADAMIEAAKRAGVILMVAHNERYMPVYRKAKELVEQGFLGRIFLARADHNQFVRISQNYWLWRKETAGGGVLIGSGIHRVDILRWLIGEIVKVWHRQVILPECFSNEVEAASVTIFEFANGAIGELTCNWSVYAAPSSPWYELLWLYGTEGSLHNVSGLHVASEKIPEWQGKFVQIPLPEEDSFVNEIRHFGECIKEGKTPLTSGEEGRKSLAVVIAAYEAAEANEGISVQI
ncbi:MAG: Gfo/Idh/MocA family oxidoreductase [Armatimonadetes bacterium]|nr:Gfo/Idh/MocA family oxidoreductase [Armatimonadota bacterium]